MERERERRKQACEMYYYQKKRKVEIIRELGCSRTWLDRWLGRYEGDQVEASLSNAKVGPKSGPSRWSADIHQQVLEMRRSRSQRDKHPYALIGAQAIHYELIALGSEEVPPVRTIHDWLVKAGLVKSRSAVGEKKKSKPIPLPVADRVNQVHQLDLKGPIYLRGCSDKYYLIVLRDRFSRRCAIGVVCNRQAQGIADFLVDSWRWLGLPAYLQIDNALEFRGSNRYPRSFGRVVRVAVDLGVEPIFNPPGEPWRNGCVERFNSFIDTHLLSIECADLQALKDQAYLCQDTVNSTHRLAALNGLTPDLVASQVTLRFPPKNCRRHQASSLPQDKGSVSFVRLVRKSGRITLGAGDRFMVDPDLAYSYVLARVDLASKSVSIFQDKLLIVSYDFSPHSVGFWAFDHYFDPDFDLLFEPFNVSLSLALHPFKDLCIANSCT